MGIDCSKISITGMTRTKFAVESLATAILNLSIMIVHAVRVVMIMKKFKRNLRIQEAGAKTFSRDPASQFMLEFNHFTKFRFGCVATPRRISGKKVCESWCLVLAQFKHT